MNENLKLLENASKEVPKMSYEIYYDRAFIRVGEKFVPLVNSGSNNCFEVSYTGREIPEKNWNVLNWKRRSQLLFTKQEIEKIAADYENISQESGTCFKSRYCAFPTKDGDYSRN